jgi:uncharacterized membrane protein
MMKEAFMPSRKTQKGDDVSKRNRFLQKKSHPLRGLVLLVISAAIVIVGGLLYSQRSMEPESVAASHGEIVYPIGQFEDGKAKHFKFKTHEGITISYFVVRSSDGVIRAAFDACDVCWPAGQGYYQEGDFMVCRNCGQRFVSDKINEIRGGCNPAPLKRRVVDGHLIIEERDLLEGKAYFDFS